MTFPFSKRYQYGFTALVITASINTTLADDIDLYITSTTGSTEVNPNVLFIIDSSGSMSAVDVPVSSVVCTTEEDVEVSGYDNDYDYPGNYDSDRIYFYDSSDPLPTSEGEPSGSFLIADSYCDLANTAIDSAGEATGHKLIAYTYSSSKWKWRSLPNGTNSGTQVECLLDEGTHGESDASTATYTDKRNNQSDPWTTDSSKKYADWDNRDTYSLYSGNKLNYQTLVNADDGTVTTVTGTTETCETVTTDQERLQVVKDVANNLITSISGINLGIMTFIEGGTEGGYVRKEVVDIDATDTTTGSSNKDLLTAVVDSIDHDGHTPLAETLYEAGRYLKGESPDFGSSSVDDAKDGTNYNSPITDSCQATNNIILLSDGQPYSDFNNNDGIQTYLNADDSLGSYLGSIYDCPADRTQSSDTSPDTSSCLVDVASFLANNDLSSLTGDQYATLYTIGFNSDIDVLADAAEAGNGNYYQSSSYSELSETLSNIILRVLASDTTFMSPAVSVNAFNRLQHSDQVYYAMFSPESDARWDGNIKKYTINDAGEILDQNGDQAINSSTGYFKDTAHSYWSDSIDGKTTSSGGARNEQTAPRTVYTYTGASAPTSSVNLDQSNYTVLDSNTALTQAMLGVSSATGRTDLINWALGYEDDGSTEKTFIGDPLHSRPTVAIYGAGIDGIEDATIFFGTNEGFLHAIDGETGAEEFAFIPQALLPNLESYFDDTAGIKTYGLDGEITLWKNDLNNNGFIYSSANDGTTTLDAGEGLYLYVGMRRGGSNYYALDVTDRSNPELMWRIEGGSGDFAELGQSWSKPALGNVSIDGSTTQVLFFGGGYDEDQDEATTPQVDDIGRSLFMVDASSGQLLWSAGPNESDDLTLSDMQYSIPANVTVGDLSNDGLTDVVFAATMGGEVWRFDIDNDNTGVASLATGGKVLDINGTDQTNNRKFFGQPDVSLFTPRGEAPYFLVSIGSGTRDNPLDQETLNRFYVKKEYSPYEAPKDSDGNINYTARVESDLYDASENLLQTGSTTEQSTAQVSLDSASGWYIRLSGTDSDNGEKVINGSTTFGGKVIFTSFTPDFTSTGTDCELNLGIARLYILDILDGSAGADLDGDGDIDGDDVNVELAQTGLPAPANIVYTQSTNDEGENIEGQTTKVLCVATECFGDLLNGDGELTKSYWRENN